jgi:hypothetical protein
MYFARRSEIGSHLPPKIANALTDTRGTFSPVDSGRMTGQPEVIRPSTSSCVIDGPYNLPRTPQAGFLEFNSPPLA